MGLDVYRKKRRFNRTPEPAGRPQGTSRRTARRLRFVVQKHRASHLHYDFRLEWDGVLLSWAVPKGPSLDPSVKRLAMHVEDHPIEYAAFEGVIPAGEYGGGTVMVWDRGTYVPAAPDVGAAVRKGELKFELRGEKLHGSWVLVRTRGSSSAQGDGRSWLLIKHRDDAASAEDIAVTAPRSVVSNRILAEIAFDEGGDVRQAATADPVDAIRALTRDPRTRARQPRRRAKVWHSNRRAGEPSKGTRPRATTTRIGPAASASRATGRGSATGHTTTAKAGSSGGRDARRNAAASDNTDLGVRVTNPTKVFWPDEGYTKLDLVRFYDRVFPALAPYVRDRILSLERCPDGMLGTCFYQKEKPAGLPADTPTVAIRHEKGVTNYVVGGRRETQLALANLGCIPIHVWGSKASAPRKPDWVCFDLDPDSGKFADAARAGLIVKEALDALELVSFPKTSGSRGLHVFVPIRIGPDADQVTHFAATLGTRLAAAYPKELTVEGRIAARKGRVYLDAHRNAFAQTVVAPYAVRRRPKAPVSTPLAWSEVTSTLDPTRFNLATFEQRLAAPDPWKDFFGRRQSLRRALAAVARI